MPFGSFQHDLDTIASPGLTFVLAVWGAVFSTLNIVYTILDNLSKKRLRLAVSSFFTGQEGAADVITIVNLSLFPVHVSDWSLSWKPRFFHPFAGSVEVTRRERGAYGILTVPAQGNTSLHFDDQYKFDWSHRMSRHRRLYLTLQLFGHKRRRLKVM